MESLDPFSYNAIRFALGALFVRFVALKKDAINTVFPWKLGVVLFIAATLQQVGLMFTGAGPAGFITGLYVIGVPLIGLLRGQKLQRSIIIAVLLAVAGMFLINRPGNLEASWGNLLVLVGAVFWAVHVQMVDYYVQRYSTAYLAYSQFAVCAVLSALSFVVYYMVLNPVYLGSAKFGADVLQAGIPILYGGLLSVGIAYSLQIKAQQKAKPGQAAVILCLEGVFAMLGGWFILGEIVDARMLIGAGLMLTAMLVSVVPKVFD